MLFRFYARKMQIMGAPLSSVGSVCDPCAEALQRTWVRLPAQVPLLRVTPPLLPGFLSHSSAILSIKPEKAKKNTTRHTYIHTLVCPRPNTWGSSSRGGSGSGCIDVLVVVSGRGEFPALSAGCPDRLPRVNLSTRAL